MKLAFNTMTYGACCGDDLVLLDAASGGYSCLPNCGPLIRLEPGTSSLEVLDKELAEGLLRIGAAAQEPGRPRPAPPLAVRELRARASASISLSHRLVLLRALASMARWYWRAPFAEVLAGARSRSLDRCGDEDRILELALVFRQLLPWIPWQGVCLYRSALLLTFLRLHGVSASWVFAVQTYPFEAHCWLQAGDLVLDDHVEHVLGLKPILVLEP